MRMVLVLRRQLLDEFLVDRGLHDVPRGANAGLAGADESAEGGVVYCLVHVEIVEDQHRRLAAQFHGLVGELLRRRRARDAAGLRAAGQHQLVDARVLGQHLARSWAEPEHDIEYARWQAGLGEDMRPAAASSAGCIPTA